VSPALPKVWACPLDTLTKSPEPVATVASSSSTMTVPSRMKNASEQFVCRCAGGLRPPGGRVRSMSEKSPFVCSATALNAITLPRALRTTPSPGLRSADSFPARPLSIPLIGLSVREVPWLFLPGDLASAARLSILNLKPSSQWKFLRTAHVVGPLFRGRSGRGADVRGTDSPGEVGGPPNEPAAARHLP
jgi:hypothetical protein